MTRGFRIKQEDNKPLLFSDRMLSTLVSEYVYGLPFVNLVNLKSLSDRVEVHIKGLDRDLYKNCYKEMNGVCDETI